MSKLSDWFSPSLACLAVLAISALAHGQSAAERSLVLVRDGQPACTIVLAKEATRAAQFAAYELQWHLKQITGAEVPIARDDATTGGARILVGESAATAALGLKPGSLGMQEYVIRFLPNALMLVGRDKADRGIVKYDPTPDAETLATWPSMWDDQGTMYAVYDFLERYCNVRWFNPTETGTVCPKTATLTVQGVDVRRAPFLRYRFACYPSSESYDQYTALWPYGSDGLRAWEASAFPRLHQQFPDPNRYLYAKRGWVQLFRFRMREGGEKCTANHSLYGYYRRFWEKDPDNPNVFVGKKPDWFAQGYMGKPPQMCYTNPELIKQVAQDARDYFDGKGINPWNGQPIKDRNDVWGENYFCVEPMDNDQFCRCPRCQALLKQTGDFDPFFSNGRHSDYFFSFVNAVARELAKTHPDKRIVTLAYMTHAAPPTHVKFEPNVIVHYCFACNRLNFDRASYQHEVNLLNQWAALRKGQPLYLWLYDTFPVEIANGGNFHCFPGFFGHTVGEQFKLFQQANVRGIFHCGYGQEVEAYLTYRLMDDPSLNVNVLLDEYFQRLYGSAAVPMKQLYTAIEQTYSTPANYPEAIATGVKEGHHHQTEEVAWGYLGTEKRMAEFARMLQAAKDAAQTDTEKTRVALFEQGIWNYMTSGREQYLKRLKDKYSGIGPAVRVPLATGAPLNGDATKLSRDEAAVLWGWRLRNGENTRRKIEGRLAQDGKYLYVQFEEQTDPRKLNSSADVVSGDHWRLLLAAGQKLPCREIAVNPQGKTVPPAWASGVVITSDTSRPDRWTVSLALPLDSLLPGGVKPGATIYANCARCCPESGDEPVWTPTFGEFNDPTRLREITLGTADAIPTGLPTAAELKALDPQGLIGRWRLNEGKGNVVEDASGNKLRGKLIGEPAWEKDRARSVLRLADRRGQCVDLGNDPAVNLTGPFSLEAWVKYEPTDTWYPAILGKGYEQAGAYSLHVRPGLTLWFEIDAEDGTRHFYNPTDLTLVPGTWNHIAATYDGAVMRVYINGLESGPGLETKTSIRKTTEPLRLGWLGSYGYLNGCVRDVSLYSRPLSRGEVYARYMAGRRG